jgi:glutathione synthase
MTLRIAIQMDPLESIDPKTDSSLRMGIEAQKRGHQLWHYTPGQLSWREGNVIATATRVTLREDLKHYYELGATERIDLSNMDVVLLRQDPPFNMAYITTTYLLERIHPKTLVVNNPAAVRNFPEKWLPTLFAEYMPPSLISSNAKEIGAFYQKHKDIVIKPFYGHGGRGVFRISPTEKNADGLIEAALLQGKEPIVAQKFLPGVKDQDRRIILIDGEYAGIFGRIPAEGDIRANIAVGGTAVKAEITPRQREICALLGATLKKEGLILAGIDMIGDSLIEINITSPTGFASIHKLYGIKPVEMFWDVVEKKTTVIRRKQ